MVLWRIPLNVHHPQRGPGVLGRGGERLHAHGEFHQRARYGPHAGHRGLHRLGRGFAVPDGDRGRLQERRRHEGGAHPEPGGGVRRDRRHARLHAERDGREEAAGRGRGQGGRVLGQRGDQLHPLHRLWCGERLGRALIIRQQPAERAGQRFGDARPGLGGDHGDLDRFRLRFGGRPVESLRQAGDEPQFSVVVDPLGHPLSVEYDRAHLHHHRPVEQYPLRCRVAVESRRLRQRQPHFQGGRRPHEGRHRHDAPGVLLRRGERQTRSR